MITHSGTPSKEAIDSNYAAVTEYLNDRDMLAAARRSLFVVFAMSASNVAKDVREFLSGKSLPVVETYNDLEASLAILRLGFPKQAFASLRMALDNGILDAYWCSRGYESNDFKRWVTSRSPTPWRRGEIWRQIEKLEGGSDFLRQFPLQEDVDRLGLGDYVHTRGLSFSTHGLFQRQARAKTSFVDIDAWCDSFFAVIRIILALQLLAKPTLTVVLPEGFLLRKFGNTDRVPLCGVLLDDHSDILEASVGAREYAALVRIGEASGDVSEVREYLESCPDLSDEEVRESLLAFWKAVGGLDQAEVASEAEEVVANLPTYSGGGGTGAREGI